MDYINQYLPVVLAALVLITLLVGALWAMNRFSRRTRGRQGQRLAISEYHVIDEQRRLVLVRRDGTEHLLLIGGGQDLVVESNIGEQHSAHDGAQSTERSLRSEPPVALRPAPRAPIFADRRPPLRSVEPSISTPPHSPYRDDGQ